MLGYRDALDQILAIPFSVEEEEIPLLQTGGRVLARGVAAPWPLPRFTNSAMDGFAVRAADVAAASDANPARLRIVGESAAGSPFGGTIEPGTAARISTGARLPDGADAVIPIERAAVDGGTVAFSDPVPVRASIRYEGEDIPQGAEVFGRGTVLAPARLAFLAMYNLPTLTVFRRPRVAILTSGDEVKPHGAELRDTDIVGVNIYYLEEEMRACGCEPRLFGIAPDDPGTFRRMLSEARDWGDIVVTTAGVSVGEHDVVGGALAALDAEVLFWRVAVRPGKPMLVARLGGVPFFGLPGNPVAVCCNTQIFLKPFLRRAFGMGAVAAPLVRATLAEDCPRDRARLLFANGRLESATGGGLAVRPLGRQSSGNLGGFAQANAFIVVEAGGGPVPAGEVVDVLPLSRGLEPWP